MPKYDGPSYEKNQDRQKKFKFPFYRDAENAASKEELIKKPQSKNKNSQPTKKVIKSEGKNSRIDFTTFQKDNISVRNYLSTIGKEEQQKQLELKKQKKQVEKRIKQTTYSKESLKHAATPFQEGRSSTPFKVQKIPSPYHGFQERSNKKIKEINYTTIRLELKKKSEDFLLFEEYLLNDSGQSFVHTEEKEEVLQEAEAMPEVETVQEVEVLPEVETVQEVEVLPEVETVKEVEVLPEIETVQEVEVLSEVETVQEVEVLPEVETIQEVEVLPKIEMIQEVDLIQTPTQELSEKITEVAASNSESIIVESSLNAPKKKRGLSRSLAGMIEEEQNIRLNRGKNVARYFGEGGTLPKIAKPVIKSTQIFNKSKIQSSEEIENMELMAALSRMNYLDKQTFPTNDLKQTEKPEQSQEIIETQPETQPETTLIEEIEESNSTNSIEESNQDEIENTVEMNSEITTSLLEMTEEVYDENYMFPSVDLLLRPVKLEPNAIDDWVLEQAEILNETLDAFNIHAQVIGWTIGPAVTQFELQLGRGVKVNKITNLSDDLKLSLAAKDIRIEAPILGKSSVGIEIPNKKSRPVMLSEVMESKEFKESHSPLTVAIGVNIAGEAVVSTIDKMPHGLIAGATGSGKSVFINSLLVSLLYKATPSEVRLILIDPKAVELAPYNEIPHLLSPVISEPKAASEALKWAVNEMEERYQKLAAAGVRNIQGFNEKAEEHNDFGLKMPYIVIVIDELADLMMVASSDVQDSIARITQKARAAGIHLIVATQRPSVDVITGTIKNNIPTRVAFMVSSQVDSRTILDTGGAEKLLGRGDMLFQENGSGRPIRVQGTYVEKEIERIVRHVKDQRPSRYLFEPESLMAKLESVEGKDELFEDVLPFIVSEGQISASALQRKFKIGFNRAANLIETLENENFISGNKGSKPREVFLTKADYEEKFL
ncbi:DNA translocase FtsK [Carnobacterium sp.]|uniref:DNA translocase FtsK n=1 Tax=Carnobacterium sp. TaxID=48221 RepID=UPI00388D38EF